MKSQLKVQLDYVNASRECRNKMADQILSDPHLFRPLLEIALETHSEVGSRACWIVEFTFKKNPEILYPHLDFFTLGLGDLKAESSIRPMAKICELLTLTHYKGTYSDKSLLSPLHRERITAACFDWLISAEKVAPKAYSMQTLALLGQDIEWVHPELKAVLEQGYASGSAGYKARARRILKILN
ncbi:MAG: adenylosuccinate lyase [Robiginitalea sp.]|uniref:adenylosuccinate lyase n=1 Tax=Robiginitalea sp. TaxID=1902411 RepID=UPI003C7410BD